VIQRRKPSHAFNTHLRKPSLIVYGLITVRREEHLENVVRELIASRLHRIDRMGRRKAATFFRWLKKRRIVSAILWYVYSMAHHAAAYCTHSLSVRESYPSSRFFLQATESKSTMTVTLDLTKLTAEQQWLATILNMLTTLFLCTLLYNPTAPVRPIIT
jgi:hypothetical protein